MQMMQSWKPRNRIRPIFMSTLTSLFGLIPLVVFPGAGSELYRGIGVVVFGGLALSTLATLIIVPPLLGIALGSRFGQSSITKSMLREDITLAVKLMIAGYRFYPLPSFCRVRYVNAS